MDDIGKLINDSIEETETKISKLSQEQKYHMLTQHFRPGPNYPVPHSFDAHTKCNRYFRKEWLDKHSWMVYSPSVKGVFCLPCILFVTSRMNKGTFINTPLQNWQKKSVKTTNHEKAQYHCEALFAMDKFRDSIEKPENTIPCLFDEKKKENIIANRAIISAIIDVAVHCAKQNQALRGDNEKLNAEGNPGNFLATLKLVARYHPILGKHLASPNMQNAKYISPDIQNEVLDIAGNYILASIIKAIQEAGIYTLLADEVTSHNKEFLALCIRFVDALRTIREEFIGFILLDRITGEYVANAIVDKLEEIGLRIEDSRGQSYDKAPNMSAPGKGVQARIKVLSPKAHYIHCNSHCLNLVIAHSCKVVSIRNMINKLQKCCLFFNNSPKRENLLKECIQVNPNINVEWKKPLIDLCKTRWSERQNAYDHFDKCYPDVIKSLNIIAYGTMTEGLSNTFLSGWGAENKSDALSLLKSLTSFEFIINFKIAYHYLSHLASLTIRLQSKALDILKAYEQVF